MTATPGLMAGWYLVTLAVLLGGPGQLPDYAYNWETYTTHDLYLFHDGDRPWSEMFHITDGLMTDSGESPFLVIPISVAWRVVGPNLDAMRLVAMVISALAVPLSWLLARRLFDAWVAFGAAAILMMTPGFVLYARTATMVGLSVGISLATAYVLYRMLSPGSTGSQRQGWLVVFLGLLVVGSYAYAPIRFYWPIALIAIAVEVVLRPKSRPWLWPSGLLVAVWPPLFLTALQALGWTRRPASLDVGAAVRSYYRGRGEQILELAQTPSQFGSYLDVSDAERAGNAIATMALRLVTKNTLDLGALVLDLQTLPVLTHHWEVHGRLYHSWLMVPGVLIGLVVLARRASRHFEARFALELVFGLSLPLVLTSRVHVGRLIYALPILLLIGAFGYVWTARTLARAVGLRRPGSAQVLWSLVPVALGLMLLISARGTWRELRVAPTPSAEEEIVSLLASSGSSERRGLSIAFVAGDREAADTEALDVAAYRLRLDDRYQFVNVALGEAEDAADPRPAVYYGGLLTNLAEDGGGLPRPCDLTYVVRQRAAEAFETAGAVFDGCDRPPRVVSAP